MRFFKKDSSPQGSRGQQPTSQKHHHHHHHHHHNHHHNNNNNGPIIDKKQVFHWQSEAGGKKSSVDDMVLLPKITEAAITDNLKRRLMEDQIYTYIGPVLVAVNPFKQLPYFGDREIELYQGAAQYEVPPHIYSLADTMYRNMLIDYDSQCVIISGESGAGKTVSAKFIMNYITKVCGGGRQVQHVKDIIMESNPLLESFGNAKTTRNNNSSRFGKYIEIQFSRGGEPLGGKVSNFLLEKSRVHWLNEGERSFHIFYQICAGASPHVKEQLGISSMENFEYLQQSSVYHVDGTNDAHDFQETQRAMTVMGMTDDLQMDILKIVAAILHMGNIPFAEQRNAAYISDPDFLQFPAYLLGIDPGIFGQKLISRIFDSKWGGQSERVDVTLNMEQAQFTRDAWTKGLYSRLFDYIVQAVNSAMVTDANLMNIGILDIYGFEIFGRNGFEQFCINYVNEKLQQIFIELTLKSEQEEYSIEGIQWKPIKFFDNKVVCELIEEKRPPGIMCILDDTCATMSAKSEGADQDFHRKMESQVGTHPHYQKFTGGFIIKHYAGNVSYHIDNFCEKNRDVLVNDIIEVMQSSDNAFIRSLFPDVITTVGAKSRPTTAGTKIRSQANELVTTLTQCIPHYIRCIKPNETKKPKDWDDQMVKHQVEYLGLKENIRVKRAGFAYRRPFDKFLQRYAILTPETWPYWRGEPTQGIVHIMKSINMDPTQYQIGRTKIFVKDPESLYMIEECRERRFDHHARIIQQAFRKYFSKQRYVKEKFEASDLLLKRKGRRANSINRNFHGDYIGVDYKPGLASLIPRREKVEFALTVDKFDRRFRRQKRDLIVTKNAIYLCGRTEIKKGPDKGKVFDVVKRKIELDNLSKVTLSTFPDNLVLLHVRNDYESLLYVEFKTEMLMVLNRKLKERCNRDLALDFSNNFEYRVRKTGWGGGGVRRIVVKDGVKLDPEFTSSGSTLTLSLHPDLPPKTRPGERVITPETRNEITRLMSGEPSKTNGHRRPHTSRRPGPNRGQNSGQNSGPRQPSGQNYGQNKGRSLMMPSGPAPVPNQGRVQLPSGPAPKPVVSGNGSVRSHKGPFSNNIPGPYSNKSGNAGVGSQKGPFSTGPFSNHSGNGGVGLQKGPYSNNSGNGGVQSHKGPFSNNIAGPYGGNNISSRPQIPIPSVAGPPPPPSDPPPMNQPSINRPGMNRAPVPIPPKPIIERPKPVIPRVKALYGYDAADTDELSFDVDDILELVTEDPSGWWTCKINGRQGFCPGTYFEKI